jgi:hypothetical protein
MMSNSRNVGPSLHKAANCAGRHTVAEANIDGEFEVIGGTPSFTEDPPGARAEVDPPSGLPRHWRGAHIRTPQGVFPAHGRVVART